MIAVFAFLVDIISIHAPHARSDGQALFIIRLRDPISIHAPHARSDEHGAEQ